jgi:RecB family exonuclease
VDLFEHKREEIFEKIKPSSFLELEVELSDFRKKLIKEKDFLGLKIIELITEVCVLYRELCEKCDNFFVSLMKQVVTLNTPRNFYIPITTTDSKFLTFDELKFNKSNFKTILILSKKNSPFSVSEGGNNELVIQFLNSIGPTKRKGLEVLYLKYELKDFLNTKEHVLLVEDEIVESDSGFRDLKSKFDINEIGLKKSPVNKVAVDVLQELIVVNELEKSKGLFSASRLQAYLDCPRKFYFTYIKKIDESPPVRMVVDAREMGKLEHDIIENYFQENSKIEEEKILELSKLKLNEYIKCSNTKIDQAIYFEVLFELVEFSKNGLSYLYELRNKYQSAKFKFEVKLPENALGITGYIDCLVEKSDGNIILDFKRSSSSVGSITELDEFQKLQLWIYYLVMNNVSNIDYVAYVNISEPERSLIYKDSLELKKDMFESFLNELIFKYQKENKYLPIPLKESVCTYCPINQVCSKGVF